MPMIQIMSFIIIIISSVFLHTHSADDNIYSAVMPQTVTALTGSCVQIPCTFTVSDFEDKRNKAKSIYGIWLKNESHFADDVSRIAFNSSKNITRGFSDIQMTGNLSERNCTTVFYNIMMNHSDVYFFRLEMEPKVFKATFNPENVNSKAVRITVKDSPQPPELKPTDLRAVVENITVNLSCSAEAPCPEQPPTISWSYIPESAQITTQLQEKPDKTQSVFSHMTFKSSYMDHRKNISCTATYPRISSNDSTVETTVIMLLVLYSPKETHITIDPSASVSVGTNVTLTCRSKGSPSREMNYTWYKHGQEMAIAQGKQITFIGTHENAGWYSCTAQNKHGNQSAEIQLTVEGQDGHFMPLIVGCVGGIVAVLTLSALGFCARKKTHRGDIVGDKDSLDQAQDKTLYRNSTYDDVLNVTTQDNMISDDYSVCERNTGFTAQTDHDTGKDQTEGDDHEKSSDVVYSQVHMILKKPKAISVVPEDIYAQVKK